MDKYIVYVKIDEQARIVAVNSSAFLPDTDGSAQIDSGYGDRYHHAQGNYFPKPIMDDNGILRYKLVDGVPAERTAEEMAADYEESESPTAEERIAALEEALDLILSGVTE